MMAEQELRPDVETAYDADASLNYDARRFRDPQGLAFQRREMEQLDRYLRHVPSGARVLEVGCGTGRFCAYLGKKGYSVHGIDPSPHMVELASDLCRDLENVTIARGEGGLIQSNDNTYDFALAIRVTNLTESREYAMRMIREMVRVVRPGGHILVEYLNSWRPRLCKDVLLSQRMITRMLRDDVPARLIDRSGILIVTHRAFSKSPAFLIPVVEATDRILSRLAPRFTDRSYALLRKDEA